MLVAAARAALPLCSFRHPRPHRRRRCLRRRRRPRCRRPWRGGGSTRATRTRSPALAPILPTPTRCPSCSMGRSTAACSSTRAAPRPRACRTCPLACGGGGGGEFTSRLRLSFSSLPSATAQVRRLLAQRDRRLDARFLGRPGTSTGGFSSPLSPFLDISGISAVPAAQAPTTLNLGSVFMTSNTTAYAHWQCVPLSAGGRDGALTHLTHSTHAQQPRAGLELRHRRAKH